MQKRFEFVKVECPGPIIGVKKEIDAGTTGVVEIVVDNIAARENVLRFLKSQGIKVEEVMESDNLFTIIADLGGKPIISEQNSSDKGVSYVINSEIMGHGDETLGKKLLLSFINNLIEIKPLPETIFFYNSGVNLCIDSSSVLKSLNNLEENGVEIIVCGTCTEFMGVTERLSVGVLGNLYDLTNIYQRNRVITI